MNTPSNQITVPIYKVAPGHSRCHFFIGERPGDLTIVQYCAPGYVTPGKYFPKDEDRGEWQQVFGMTLSDPRSADAWSKIFRHAAKTMRKLERESRKAARRHG